MIHRINIFLLSLILTFAPAFLFANAYAGAAEDLWKFEPVRKDIKTIGIQAYKTNAVGAAVNDAKYATAINTEGQAARIAMGKTMMNRVLGVAGWSTLGVQAVKKLLDGIGWVMDPDAQSIWRYKKNPSNGPVNITEGHGSTDDYGCNKTRKNNRGETVTVIYLDDTAQEFNCAYDAAIAILRKNNEDGLDHYESNSYHFDKWRSTDLAADSLSFIGHYIIRRDLPMGGGEAKAELYIKTKDAPPQKAPEKEILTPERLGDIMTGKDPDIVTSPDAPPVWTGVTEAYTPGTTPEEQTAPTVEIVKEAIEGKPSSEQSPDSEVKPNPQTGGSTLPNFCSWATTLCDFVGWTKRDEVDKDTNLEFPNTPAPTATAIDFNGSCPAPIKLADFNFHGNQVRWEIDFSKFCDVLTSFIRPVVVAGASLSAILIVSGTRENG